MTLSQVISPRKNSLDYWKTFDVSDLNILYQDEYLIAIDKPAGMLVHPGRDPEPDEHIAMKALRNYLEQYVYIVHRLDRPTSGVLLFTLNKTVQSAVSIQFQTWKVKKRYFAVVVGEAPEEFEVDLPVKRNEESEAAPSLTRSKRVNYSPPGKLAEQGFSFLDVEPHTGRFHQIRRHLAWSDLPIVGDYLYGDIETNDHIAEQTGIKRMMLMSNSLEFTHPITQESVKVQAETSKDFAFYL
jgi:tRNA pseudouridine65 synthase